MNEFKQNLITRSKSGIRSKLSCRLQNLFHYVFWNVFKVKHIYTDKKDMATKIYCAVDNFFYYGPGRYL